MEIHLILTNNSGETGGVLTAYNAHLQVSWNFSDLIRFQFYFNELFQKELTGRPKSSVPLGGAGDAFEAEYLHELECIENILISLNSHTEKRWKD